MELYSEYYLNFLTTNKKKREGERYTLQQELKFHSKGHDKVQFIQASNTGSIIINSMKAIILIDHFDIDFP